MRCPQSATLGISRGTVHNLCGGIAAEALQEQFVDWYQAKRQHESRRSIGPERPYVNSGFVKPSGNQMFASMNAANWVLDSAPTLVASTLPFLNNISVGMPRIPYFGGVA